MILIQFASALAIGVYVVLAKDVPPRCPDAVRRPSWKVAMTLSKTREIANQLLGRIIRSTTAVTCPRRET